MTRPVALDRHTQRKRGLLPPIKLTSVETLFLRWEIDRDLTARDEIARRFFPLAKGLAARYAGKQVVFDDLLQVASVGLIKAIDLFDPARGTAFSSYALPTILGELKRSFRDTGWSVHVPRTAQELALKVERTARELTAVAGREPSVEQIADSLDLDVEDVLAALEAAAAHHSNSLDAPTDGGESEFETLADSIGADDDRLRLVETKLMLSAAAAKLPHQQRQVLELRFAHDMKQTQIAEQLGCSQMHVSRLLYRATTRLSKLTELQPLRPGQRDGLQDDLW